MEAGASALVEPPVGYHSWIAEFLTCGRESGRGTLLGGQFDWGGRLPKGNGGAQRFPQYGRKSYEECKGKRELDCKTYRSSKVEIRT